MLVIGLTGSIGMGKSTAAAMLRRAGLPVFDADRTVHRLMGPGGAAVAPLLKAFPEISAEQSVATGVDRAALSNHVAKNPDALKVLEAVLHPLVRQAQRKARRQAAIKGARILILDIPLLFETGGDQACDAVFVVSAPALIQRQRVLRRPGMTAQKLNTFLAKQMPDRVKRRRADRVIQTGLGFAFARRQMLRAIAEAPGIARQNRKSPAHPPLFGPSNRNHFRRR
ncbi:MAG: dephospho-CoA kinase [Alphaproteobacteria bacterium]|nr:dephospho-CoA kinase [Alphaproteobacteria bacterium SS10]